MPEIQIPKQMKDILPEIGEDDWFSRVVYDHDIQDSTRGRAGSLGECDPRSAYIELVYLLRKYDGEIDGSLTYHNLCVDLNHYFTKVWGTRYTLFETENEGSTRERRKYCSVAYLPFEYQGNSNKFIISEDAPYYEIKRIMEILIDFQKWCANIPEYETEMIEMKAHEFADCFGNIEEIHESFVDKHWQIDPLGKEVFKGPGKDTGKSIKEQMGEMSEKIFGKKRQK